MSHVPDDAAGWTHRADLEARPPTRWETVLGALTRGHTLRGTDVVVRRKVDQVEVLRIPSTDQDAARLLQKRMSRDLDALTLEVFVGRWRGHA